MQRSIRLSPGLFDPTATRDRLAEMVKLVRDKVAMQVLEGVVLATPVDTGRARSNWNVSTESPDFTTGPALAPGSKGSTGADNASGTIARGAAVISSAPGFGTVWISNGLPYINRLEHGWSKQAPAGMVRITLDRVEGQFA